MTVQYRQTLAVTDASVPSETTGEVEEVGRKGSSRVMLSFQPVREKKQGLETHRRDFGALAGRCEIPGFCDRCDVCVEVAIGVWP